MRQIIYASLSSVPAAQADLSGILLQSRHNNALEGITGLLWSDGDSFLQVFEGPRASVALTFERILADSRHHSIRVLADTRIDERAFGSWDMAFRRAGEMADEHDLRMARILSEAEPAVRGRFVDLVATRPRA